MESLGLILDEAQRSAASHTSCGKRLAALLQENDGTRILQALLELALDNLLIVAKKDAGIERLLKFLSNFFSNSADESTVCTVLEYLAQRSMVTDKAVRFRACQLLADILNGLNAEFEFNEALWSELSVALSQRLIDKNATVRLWTVRAASKLQDASNPDDEMVNGIMRCMLSDSSAAIRAAAVDVIVLSKSTLSIVVDRIRDAASEVRIACIRRLDKDVFIRHLSAASRIQIIKYGLFDREESVQRASVALVMNWLKQLDYRVPKFLNMFNVGENEVLAEKLGWVITEQLEAFRESGDPKEIEAYHELRTIHPTWQSSFESVVLTELFWVKVRCDYSQKNLTKATRDSIHQGVLPDLLVLCDLLLDANIVNLHDNVALQTIFKSILYITRYVDLNDTVGCEKLSELCCRLLDTWTFPDTLTADVLDAWQLVDVMSAEDGHLTRTLQGWAVANIAEYGKLSEEDENRPLVSLRIIQVLNWMLSRQIKAQETTEANRFLQDNDILVFIWGVLQEPYEILREEAMKLLGYFAMCCDTGSSVLEDISQIFKQCIAADIESDDIRANALRVLYDIYMIRALPCGDFEIILLSLIQQCSSCDAENCILFHSIVEVAIKLLYSEHIRSSQILAYLMKFFFSNRSAEEEAVHEHIIQLLSIFFQAVFIHDSKLLSTACDAISDLIADAGMIARSEEDSELEIDRIAIQILGLIDQLSTDSGASNSHSIRFRATFTACLCREVLKFSCNRSDKAAAKEFVKILCRITPDSWIQCFSIDEVIPVMLLVKHQVAKLDKATQTLFETYLTNCKACTGSATPVVRFDDLAVGLRDIVLLSAADSDDEASPEVSKPAPRSRALKGSNPRRRAVESSSDEESEDCSSEDDMMDES